MKRRLQGEKEAEAEDEEANLFEPEWMDDDGEALQESDVEDGAVMVAVPLKGKGAADESMVSDPAQKEKVEESLGGLTNEQQESSGPLVGLEVSSERSQPLDWLHRGQREPLASMGMYVYYMYVYTAAADPMKHHPQDFRVYRFADTHPSAGRRVQKLRVDEMFKIPRLFGFTMPRMDTECEKNAMFKSVLFRPIFAESRDQVEAFMAHLDENGKFKARWERWFQLQRIMADRYYWLQQEAGKLFTIADIDVDALEMSDPVSNGRVRPSAAEFIANIVVEVVTNMDMDKEAKSRPRKDRRPSAGEYGGDELIPGLGRSGDPSVQPEPRMPAGPGHPVDPDLMQDEELSKGTVPLCPVPDTDILSVAFSREYGATHMTADFKKEFDQTFGKVQYPRSVLGADVERQDYTGMELGRERFKQFREMQEQAFDYRKEAAVDDASALPSRGDTDPFSGGGVDPVASIVTEADSRPGGYAKKLIKEAAERSEDPVVFCEEQKNFIAVVAAKLEEILDFKIKARESISRGEQVQQSVMLLHGQGGSGKTEVVKLVRKLLSRFSMGEKAVASTNSAARIIEGDTVHSALVLPGTSSLKLSVLDKNINAKLIDSWNDVDCLIVEEVSMVSPTMLGALSYRSCWARREKF